MLKLSWIRDIYEIGQKLQKDLTDTVLNSHISMKNLEVVIYIGIENNIVRFDRHIERRNTKNRALKSSFYFDTKHLYVKRKVGFNRAMFLYKQLEEI